MKKTIYGHQAEIAQQQREEALKRIEAYAKYIRKKREEKGMSQEEFANKCGHFSGSARSWTSKVESGKIRLSLDDAENISKALGVSPLDLLGLDNTPVAGDNAPKIDFNNDDIHFIEQYKKLSEKGKSKARERIEELLILEGKQ